MAKKGDIYIDFSKMGRGLGVVGRSLWKLILLPFRLLEWAIDHLFEFSLVVGGLFLFASITGGIFANEMGIDSWPEFKQATLTFITEAISFVKEIIQTIKDNV